ncbi:hypothetical protein Rhe02_56300 [Rhizocola hellebori]|uniref:Uncharacterized protein n=1 Tax=Rhizocola hellebori TaxID=1392758 RepID=A0A8J3QB36_9ACTN|nr:hypothetical protein Rhe02_56300 [Rhizocola hellebori]
MTGSARKIARRGVARRDVTCGSPRTAADGFALGSAAFVVTETGLVVARSRLLRTPVRPLAGDGPRLAVARW